MKQKQQEIKKLEQDFNAGVAACFNLLRASKVLYKAGFIEEAFMSASDAYLYAGLASESMYKLSEDYSEDTDVENEEINQNN